MLINASVPLEGVPAKEFTKSTAEQRVISRSLTTCNIWVV